METQFLKTYLDVLDWCYKDEQTIFLLKKCNQSANSSIVEILEIDVLLQTIRKQVEAPLFEGVQADDGRYNLVYCQKKTNEGQLLLIYPSNIVICYDSDNLELLQVVQSSFNIVCPVTIQFNENVYFTFMDHPKIQNPASNDQDKLIMVPIQNIDELGKKNKNTQVIQIKCPFKSGTVIITDINQNSINQEDCKLLLSFSNGKIWSIDPFSVDKVGSVIGIDQYRDQLGEQKLYQVNCIDQIYVAQQKCSFLLIGDANGRLSIVRDSPKNKNVLKFIFHEQISYNQIISVKWLSTSHNLIFAFITSDGSFQVQKAIITQSPIGQAIKCELKKLCQVSMFEEVANQFNFASQYLRQNQSIQLYYRNGCGFPNTIGIMWPERIIYKINKRTAEKKVLIEKKLCMFKLYDQFLPNSKIGAPIMSSQGVPLELNELIPTKQDDQLISEPYIFYVDQSSDSSSPIIFAYQIYDGKKQSMIDVRKESGLLNEQYFDILKLDVRPKQLEESNYYRFLVQLGMSESQTNMCLCFQYDMQTQKLKGKVQQFFGIDSLFIGRPKWKDPILLTLQEDMKTLQLISFDPKHESKLPRGNVQLLSKVKQIFWSPFSDGMAVLYESLSDNLIRFSKNRLETNQVSDFSILAQSKYTFKLQYDENVFGIQWTGFRQPSAVLDPLKVKGAITTNHRICIVDSNLAILNCINFSNHYLISSIQWLGSTLIYSAERHLMYLTQAKTDNNGILCSFNCHDQANPTIIGTVLSDRVILSSVKHDKVEFLNKQIVMLECILLGYLSSTPKTQINLDIIKRCLTYLDTSLCSQTLINKLSKLNFYHSAQFIMNNPNCTQQFEKQQRLTIGRALGMNDLETILGINDTSDVMIHKLRNEAEYSLENSLIREQLEIFKKSGQMSNAFKCAQLLLDTDEGLNILKQNGLLGQVVANIDEFSTDSNADIFTFLEKAQKPVKMSKLKKFGIPDEKHHGWGIKFPESDDFVNQKPITADQELENINRLNLGYDETPFSYLTKLISPNDKIQAKLMHSVTNDNLANWLGHDSLVSDNNGGAPQNMNQAFQMNLAQKIGDPEENEQINDDDGLYLSDSKQHDDFEEKPNLVFYLRMDEGKGQLINDMTDNELSVKMASNCEWSEDPLEDGNPIDFEDKWGKKNQASYSVQIDGFSGEQEGIKTSFPQSVIEKFKLRNNFSMEFWVKIEISRENCSIMLMKSRNFDIKLEKGGFLSLQYENSDGSKLQTSLKLEIDPFKSTNWQHLCLINSANQNTFTVLLNSLPIGVFKETKLTPKLTNDIPLTLIIPSNLRLSIAELRFWGCNLPQSVVKDNWKQPLSMLYEQKRAIKIKIRKRGTEENATGLKKPGLLGLKMASQFDKKIKQKKQEEESKNTQEIQVISPTIKQESVPIILDSNPISQNVPDAFDFFSQPAKIDTKPQQPSYDFDFGFSSDPIKPSQQSAFDFFGDTAVIEEPIKDTGFFSNLEQEEEFKVNLPNSSDINKSGGLSSKDDTISQISDFDYQPQFESGSKQTTIVINNESPLKISKGKLTGTVTVQNSAVTTIPRSFIMNAPPKQQKMDQTNVAAELLHNLVLEKPEEIKQLHSDQIQNLLHQIIHLMLISKLNEADKLIEDGFIMCRSHDLQADKDTFKRGVRAFSTYKLTNNLSLAIAHLKFQLAQESIDKKLADDLQSQISSYSNMLIILQLPPSPEASLSLKRAFLQFALNQNIKLKNFSATSKIIQFYRKQVPNSSDQEKTKIDQIDTMCKKYQEKNLSQRPGYQNADCPKCAEPLVFGIATPQCHKCKTKIGVCYMTLQPVNADIAHKCNLCLARFSSGYQFQSPNKAKVCPICSLSKIE